MAVVRVPSVVYVRKSSALRVAISPSSRVTTWRVWRTSAATSEATNISFSPMPRTTGRAVAGHHDPVREVARAAPRCRTCPRPPAAPRGPSPPACRPAERAMRWASTSVSVSETKATPSAVSLARSSAALSMMPLWTTATVPSASRCGCALTSLGAPWVAQRVWRDAGGAGEPLGDPRPPGRAPGPWPWHVRSSPDRPVIDDAGRVVAAVLQPLQTLQQQGRARHACRCSRRFRTCAVPLGRTGPSWGPACRTRCARPRAPCPEGSAQP